MHPCPAHIKDLVKTCFSADELLDVLHHVQEHLLLWTLEDIGLGAFRTLPCPPLQPPLPRSEPLGAEQLFQGWLPLCLVLQLHA